MTVGRNAPCHCGSGIKYKKCCLQKDEATRLHSSPPAKTNDQGAQGKVVISYWVVAFLDILGYRQLLKRLSRPPAALEKDDPDLTKDMVRAISIRRDLIGMIETFKLAMEEIRDRPLTGLPPQMDEIRKAWSQLRVKLAHFSDSITLHMSLHDSSSFDVRMGHLHNILIGCCGAQLMQLARGHDDINDTLPLRGAIDINVGTEYPDRLRGSPRRTGTEANHPELLQLYSPALATAYELEQTIAVYPRVIVSDPFRAMLYSHIEDQTVDDYQAEANRSYARRNAAFLTQDSDGVWFVDFMGEGFRSISGQLGQVGMAEQAWRYVKAAHAYYGSGADANVARKYQWLRDYMVSRLNIWGIQE
jgi:hypothetical protein